MGNKFLVGWCKLDLYIENCHSLKEKRRVVKSLKERLKNQYNVAVCEYGDLSLWQRVQIGIVTCSNDRRVIDSMIKTVLNFVDRVKTVSVLNYSIDIQ